MGAIESARHKIAPVHALLAGQKMPTPGTVVDKLSIRLDKDTVVATTELTTALQSRLAETAVFRIMIDFSTSFHRFAEPDSLCQVLNRLNLAQNMLALFEGCYRAVRMAIGIIGDDNAFTVAAVKLGFMLTVADASNPCLI